MDWISNCIQYLQNHNITRIEPTEKGVQEWTEHVHKIAEGFLSNEIDSWMTGVNKNVAGKQKRIVARYNGSAPVSNNEENGSLGPEIPRTPRGDC